MDSKNVFSLENKNIAGDSCRMVLCFIEFDTWRNKNIEKGSSNMDSTGSSLPAARERKEGYYTHSHCPEGTQE